MLLSEGEAGRLGSGQVVRPGVGLPTTRITSNKIETTAIFETLALGLKYCVTATGKLKFYY